MRAWCWHDWTKWKSYAVEGTHQPAHPAMLAVKFSRLHQARVCTKCAKEVHRRVEDSLGAKFEELK
jgi:hypothetical protein